MKVLVTGASGVLGSAIYKAFKAAPDVTVKGLSHSRPTADLEPVDLTDEAKTRAVFEAFQPDWVIHCAAERRPDVADKNPEATRFLNSEVPAFLASLSAGSSPSIKPFTLIYISTDYVFPGDAPPAGGYTVSSTPRPLQLYGETKLAGEESLRAVDAGEEGKKPGQRVVLRVPVLYGPCEKPSDSAINVLLDVVRDQSGKEYKMDHWATRYPTNVKDIAAFLAEVVATHPTNSLPSTLHFSAPEPYTKYEICLLLSSLHSPPLPHAHIIPDSADPIIPPGGVGRPRDCQLNTSLIEETLGMEVKSIGFEEWWAGAIREGRF